MNKLLFCICLTCCANTYAATSATIDVSAVIEKGCLFQESAMGLDYGTHATSSQESAVQANIQNTSSTWNIECTPDVPVSISFSNGNYFDASTQFRRLKNTQSNHYIQYSLYSDNARTKLIGTAAPANSLSLKSTVSQHLLNFGVYGLVDLSQGAANKAAGDYADTVQITISW
jgi:spore coat protein U-like protein